MKTQSRILLSVVSSFVVSIVVAFIVFSILRGMNTEHKRITAFSDIIHKTYALSVLTASFKVGSGRSDVRQVKEILLSLDRLLKGISSQAPREEALIKQLQQSHQELGPLIDHMSVSGQIVSGIERERRDTLATQIWMKVQFISDDTNELMDISQSRIISAQEKAGAMVIVLIIILTLTNGTIYFLSARGIVRGQEALRRSERNLTAELYAAQRLQQVSTQLIQADHIEALYDQILDTAMEILHSDFASIQMLYPERGSGGELRLLGYRGFTAEAAEFWEWVSPASHSSSGVALRTGQRVVTPDVRKCDSIAGSDDMKMYVQTGIRAVQTTPLLSRSGTLLGMISTHWREPHELTPSEIRALDILARQAADLTERLQAEGRLSSDLAALTRMHELSGMLLGAGGTQSLLQKVMEAAVAIAGAERGTLQLVEGDSLRIVAHHGHRQPFLEFFASAENRASVCGCGEVMTCGERVIVPDVETSSLFAGTVSLTVLREAGVRAVQSTPMISRTGALLGILTTQWEVPYTPNERDLWRIDLLVRQAADLIEHSQSEEALRASEERFRTLAEASSDVLYRMSPDWSEMRHLRSGDFLADTEKPSRTWLEEYIHPDDRSHVTTIINKTIRNKSIFELEHRVLRVDGTLGWTFSRAVPLLNANGEIVEWFGAASDITDRKRAEEALRESELVSGERAARLQAILDAAPSIIWTAHDRECNSITGNRAAERFSRAPEGTNMSKTGPAADRLEHYRILHDGVELKPHELPIQRVSASGNPLLDYAIDFIFEDGTMRSLLGNVVPVLDDSSQTCGAIAAFIDITERRLMEEELRRSRNELEVRVRERTTELESKNRELQEFAYVASHDLSEPLRKIQTFGDLLKAKSGNRLGDQERDYVSRMTGAANRMQELLDALLRYSRIETQGRDLVPVKLEDIVQTVTTDLEVSIKKTGAHVEVGPLPMINGDPYQWRQLFQNLIANAVKYHRSEVKTVIKVYGEENDGTGRIFVEDNGIGFDEKYLDKIFQPFQRLHGKNEYPGTGIGLAICRKIVERHKGTITASSTPGRGSTFIITLPAKQEDK